MSERFADITARIETVHKLDTVIGAMRGIAAARVHEAQAHLDSIHRFEETIGRAIGEALALFPAPQAEAQTAGRARPGLLVFATEQGFVGSYSERIFEALQQELGQDPAPLVFLVGERGLAMAEEHDVELAWSAPMIAHAAQAASLATRIGDALFAPMAAGEITSLSILHAIPSLSEEVQIAHKPLLPFDYDRFAPPQSQVPPRITLPPERLLQRLVEEYLFAELSAAVMLSFAAENEARMRAMIAAQDNTAETLDDMTRLARRLRQEEITEEIIELATADL
ncbi:F0F1 ATP synthase subunit gamma [Celeribacter neptunius]|uniref:F-type H+-transporting ATPase subunit gamma n=1 Tax=Celeribacter neptunius TaxID=588602 RepID=A0A1I3NTW8_9RHOB|nr:F0F1 ATP synthase subunit gamma [Celeribacter neptunius]SFJ12592.1 F-type H+-transporting ATPase subunit gamma [Celeribacter neptunius]